MAAADSRAGWKRNTDHPFIHENVSRAANLSSFPSSSSSSRQQSNDRLGGAAHQSDHPLPNCIHQNRSPLEDLLPDSKWWLYPQPNVGHQKGFEYEQLNTLETELDMSYEFINQAALEEFVTQIEMKKNDDSFLNLSEKVSAASKTNTGVHSNTQRICKDKGIEEFWCMEDLETVNNLFSEQSEKLSSDLESHWMKAEKTEPWWRNVDKDTLASIVARSSVEHIENCDLPQPQTKHFRRGLSASPEQSDQGLVVTPSLDQTAELGLSNLTDCTGNHTSVSMDEKKSNVSAIKYTLNNSETLFRNNGHSMTGMDQEETCHIPENVSKAELVKALCHSQTRAREAEKAAQKAYEEKQHIIKLFFKQASQLLAYKQWLQLLQLENIPVDPKNNDQPISGHVPTVLPRIPYDAQKRRKCQYRGQNKKGSRTNGNGINKYAVAFALAGAGLLLGWTLAWLFPGIQTASQSTPALSSVHNSDSG